MKKSILLIGVISLLASCKNEQKKAPSIPVVASSAPIDSFLITDSSWGLIDAGTNIEKLKTIFGEENIRDVRECDAECIDSIDVTKVYPGQPDEITIIWKDSAYHLEIGLIECFGEGPRWHSASGIRIGSGLKDLLKVNGKKISFYGFGWDGGGLVDSYHDGALQNSVIGYRLNLDAEYSGDRSLFGDVGLDTDMPVVQQALDKISVWWITLSFYKPGGE
ncbi:MAG: hypothetical protein ACO25B_12775 [Chitinophagaceae bacterium]